MKINGNALRPSLNLLLATALLAMPAIAQDSHYRPEGQQFPSPDCLSVSNAYSAALSGGYSPCPAGTHEEWLKDLQHWRTERRIRIGYDGARYSLPALAVDAVQLHPAADDGAGPLSSTIPSPENTPSTAISTTSRSDMAASTPCSSGRPIRTWASTIAISTTWSAPCPAASPACSRWWRTSTGAACACCFP